VRGRGRTTRPDQRVHSSSASCEDAPLTSLPLPPVSFNLLSFQDLIELRLGCLTVSMSRRCCLEQLSRQGVPYPVAVVAIVVEKRLSGRRLRQRGARRRVGELGEHVMRPGEVPRHQSLLRKVWIPLRGCGGRGGG
jgi:hypothetical protein